MRQSLKIAYSLLITVVLFSGFAVLAFSGLFDFIETGFFQPRVRAEVLSRLDSAASAVGEYHDRNLEYFESFLVSSGAASLIGGGSPDDPNARTFNQAFGDLQVQVAALTSVRIVEAERNLIHYSSLSTDLRESTATKESYKRLDEADDTVAADRLGVDEGTGPLLIDGPRNRFIYILPVDDKGATALFYVDAIGLSTYLLREAAPVGKGVSTLAENGVLLDASPTERDAILDGLLAALGTRPGAKAPFDVPLSVDAPAGGAAAARRVEYQAFALFAPRSGGDWGLVVRLEPRDAFEMSLFLKVLLLASFFVTVFLLTYLLFNLRPDPLEVVSQRVKRFQVQLLESLLERDGTADWGRWRGELERRRGEITQQVQRGIGRVSKRQQPEIDAFIDKGWGEILDLLARRAESAQAPAALDVSRIENLIQQALKSASFVVPAQIIGTTPAQSPKPAAGTPIAARGAPIQVEELRAEEVEDLPEAESVEDIPEASLEESVSEVEPVGKAVKVLEVSEAEEVTDAEEVAEAEEVTEAEDVAEAEEITEAEDVAEAEEIEELEEAGPADDAAAAPEHPAELSIQVAETLQARAPEAPAVDSFMDTLEELETVTELTPLPPLPEEEGLEMLPTADDGGPRKSARHRGRFRASGIQVAGTGRRGCAGRFRRARDARRGDRVERRAVVRRRSASGDRAADRFGRDQDLDHRAAAEGGRGGPFGDRGRERGVPHQGRGVLRRRSRLGQAQADRRRGDRPRARRPGRCRGKGRAGIPRRRRGRRSGIRARVLGDRRPHAGRGTARPLQGGRHGP